MKCTIDEFKRFTWRMLQSPYHFLKFKELFKEELEKLYYENRFVK